MSSKKYHNILLYTCLPLAAFATVFNGSNAYAGFKWIAPEVKETPKEKAVNSGVDNIDVLTEDTPAVSPAPVIKSEVVPASDVNQVIANSIKGQILEGTIINNVVSDDVDEVFDVVEGFGTDIPLALVLRQIVPAKYSFSFGDGVDLGARVSWQGGKAWNLVLEEAIAPLNLSYKINSNNLKLYHIDSFPSNNIDVEKSSSITPVIDENVDDTLKKK